MEGRILSSKRKHDASKTLTNGQRSNTRPLEPSKFAIVSTDDNL
jgi:hypothetical protein